MQVVPPDSLDDRVYKSEVACWALCEFIDPDAAAAGAYEVVQEVVGMVACERGVALADICTNFAGYIGPSEKLEDMRSMIEEVARDDEASAAGPASEDTEEGSSD
jgi:hypothetical protein